jgi:hypothetical protein
MVTLQGYAMPAARFPFVDHTYIGSSDGNAWGCFGRDSGGWALSAATGTSDRRFADCLSHPKEIALHPQLYAGLKYFKTGVCHQAANRILYLTGMSVGQAVGCRWIVARFSFYGKGPWPELAQCATRRGSTFSGPPSSVGVIMKNDKHAQFSGAAHALYAPPVFQGLDNQENRLALKRQELLAMATTYLGEEYDREKIKKVIEIQILADMEQDRFLARLENNEINSETYLDSLERLFAVAAKDSERILGAEDFEKLFGIPASAATAMIDREHFLRK